jgi:hypothetical protein
LPSVIKRPLRKANRIITNDSFSYPDENDSTKDIKCDRLPKNINNKLSIKIKDFSNSVINTTSSCATTQVGDCFTKIDRMKYLLQVQNSKLKLAGK